MDVSRSDEALNIDSQTWRETCIAIVLPLLLVGGMTHYLGKLLPVETLKPWVNERALSKVVVYESAAKRATIEKRLFLFGDSTAAGFSLDYVDSVQGQLEYISRNKKMQLQPFNVSLVASGYRDPLSVAGHFEFQKSDVIVFQVNSAPELNHNFYEIIHQTASVDLLPESFLPKRRTPFTAEVERKLNCGARSLFPLLAQSELYEDYFRNSLRGTKKRAEGERRRALWFGEVKLKESLVQAVQREYQEPNDGERQFALEQYRILAKQLKMKFNDQQVVVYLNPLNREYIEVEAGVVWEDVQEWIRNVESVFEAEGVRVFDLSELLPADLFFDDNHPNAEGSTVLASEILRMVQ